MGLSGFITVLFIENEWKAYSLPEKGFFSYYVRLVNGYGVDFWPKTAAFTARHQQNQFRIFLVCG
jgi:hypothetical protein